MSEVNRSLYEILHDLFLDAYELGVVAKEMRKQII